MTKEILINNLFPNDQEELEIIEFSLGDSSFGVKIADIREIIKADVDIVSVPDANPFIEGAINLRGTIIPIINLAKFFHADITYDKKSSRIIISEFDQTCVGFWVTAVSMIHHITRDQVEEPSQLLQTKDKYAIAVVKLEDHVIFLMDFCKIANHIPL